MSNEINQKFYQMRNTLSKIKNEINTMQKKISTHSSFSSVRHNDSCIANPHNYTSYNQNDIPKQKQITFYKYPTSSLLNANHFIKNKKLLSYTKRVQRKSHPVKVTNESLNVLCDLLEDPSSQMKQKIKKTFAISKEEDDNILAVIIKFTMSIKNNKKAYDKFMEIMLEKIKEKVNKEVVEDLNEEDDLR